MTIDELIVIANNGEIPSFEQIKAVFHGRMECWNIRMALFGHADAAIMVANELLDGKWTWHIGYDNRAVLERVDDPDNQVICISISPGRALILGVLMAYRRELETKG